MAECIVEVCKIQEVKPHLNADALELTQIKGWQVVVPKGRYLAGDLVVYIPIDSVIPPEWSDKWGITRYLSHGRVRCARLRGEPSFGVIVDRDDPAWPEGLDVREHYGIQKYIPPFKPLAGDAETAHPLFVSYTDIENMRHYHTLLAEGEMVIVTEKIHGTNCRVGMIEGEVMAGSMSVRRKRPEEPEKNTYWLPITLPGVMALLAELGASHRQVILFGEVYGRGIQSLHYGCEQQPGFAAFDLLVDGRYLDWDAFQSLCERFGMPVVPVLWRGPFSLPAIRQLSQGDTTLPGHHLREGVVVKPLAERTDPTIGRVILKYISDEYLLDRNISDSFDV